MILIAFFLGSIPSGLLAVKLLTGSDPRKAGSGNIGFTNVLRVSSRAAAALTLLGDVGKGALAVWLMRQFGGSASPGPIDGMEMAAGLAAVTGHMFTPFLRFKGGKGVATALGALLVAAPWVALITVIVWGVVLAASSYVSLASIVASATLPVTLMLFTGNPLAIGAGFILAALVIVRHNENIQRLRAGRENTIRKPSDQPN